MFLEREEDAVIRLRSLEDEAVSLAATPDLKEVYRCAPLLRGGFRVSGQGGGLPPGSRHILRRARGRHGWDGHLPLRPPSRAPPPSAGGRWRHPAVSASAQLPPWRLGAVPLRGSDYRRGWWYTCAVTRRSRGPDARPRLSCANDQHSQAVCGLPRRDAAAGALEHPGVHRHGEDPEEAPQAHRASGARPAPRQPRRPALLLHRGAR